MADKKLTIGDVAEQLGVSPSTVSRAISGKGRIGKETREKVLDFVREHDYRPAGSEREIAYSRTNNIAILIPDVRNLAAIPFYYMCMCGVNEVAQARGYDMFVITLTGKDTGRLKSLIDKNKVDGIILGNTHKNDVFARYLKSRQLPFVTIGSLEDETVVQIDHDNRGACRDLTAILLSRKLSRIAYMGQRSSLIVDEDRYEGYVQAHLDAGIQVDPEIVCMDNSSRTLTCKNVDKLLEKQVDCILCQDDALCNIVLQELRSQNVKIPQEMRVASCYSSQILEACPVPVTSLKFNNTEIGRTACDVLIDLLEGCEVPQKTILDYEVVLKESTK